MASKKETSVSFKWHEEQIKLMQDQMKRLIEKEQKAYESVADVRIENAELKEVIIGILLDHNRKAHNG